MTDQSNIQEFYQRLYYEGFEVSLEGNKIWLYVYGNLRPDMEQKCSDWGCKITFYMPGDKTIDKASEWVIEEIQ